MTPQARLLKTIQAEAGRSNSDFEVITHRGVDKKAKIHYGDFTKSSKSELDDWELQDEISFLNSEIQFVSKGDEITYNSVVYTVAHFTLVMQGVYNIFATKKLRTGSMI